MLWCMQMANQGQMNGRGSVCRRLPCLCFCGLSLLRQVYRVFHMRWRLATILAVVLPIKCANEPGAFD